MPGILSTAPQKSPVSSQDIPDPVPAHAVPPGTLSAHHTADTSHLRTSPLPLLHNPETPGSISQNLPRYGAGRDYSVFSYILSFLFRPAGSLSITWAPPPDDSEHSAPLPHCGYKYCVRAPHLLTESSLRNPSAGRTLLPGYRGYYSRPPPPDILRLLFRSQPVNGWDAGDLTTPFLRRKRFVKRPTQDGVLR